MREYLVIHNVPNGTVIQIEAENKREALKMLNEKYGVLYRFTSDRAKETWFMVEKSDWYNYRFSKVSSLERR